MGQLGSEQLSFANFSRATLKGATISMQSGGVEKALVSLFVVLLCATSYAQNPTGALRGDVQDLNGGRVPSAAIVVQAAGSSLKRETKTDDHGEFRLSELLPGTYHVVVAAKGFAEAQADVAVVVSSVRDLTVTLHPAAVRETVNVEAQPSSITTQPIDLASAVHQATVSTQDLQTLPLAARSFANIAYLAPGTEPVEPSDPTKARITAVSTGGSSGLNNELSVDGGTTPTITLAASCRTSRPMRFRNSRCVLRRKTPTLDEPLPAQSSSLRNGAQTTGMAAGLFTSVRQL